MVSEFEARVCSHDLMSADRAPQAPSFGPLVAWAAFFTFAIAGSFWA